MGESFLQKDSLVQYTMTVLQGPKDPVLPNLMSVSALERYKTKEFEHFELHSIKK